MKYLVIQKFHDGNCYIAKPNNLLSIDEARSLVGMLSRTDPDHEYFIVEQV